MQSDIWKTTDHTSSNVNYTWYVSDPVLNTDINLFTILQQPWEVDTIVHIYRQSSWST